MSVRDRIARFRQSRKKFDYVFVVTYGRSGSTLVQGLLNTLPRTMVRGENNLYLLPFFEAEKLAREFKDEHITHGAGNVISAFYGLHDLRIVDFARNTGEFVTRQLLGRTDPDAVDTLGFKEVVWHRIAPEDTEEFFRFMDDAFPGARYVLNQRDHEAVAGSGFWQNFEQTEVHSAIARVEEIQEHLRKTRPDRVLDLRYELLTSDDQAVSDAQLRSLAEFVTSSCDPSLLDALRETRSKGHGPNPFGKSRGRKRAPQPD
ncbi:MAG TPA: sulfotransferase [Nocardioidaceae bacterium]|nr:sulfotransferase [Nocardioidaceae bacterium]